MKKVLMLLSAIALIFASCADSGSDDIRRSARQSLPEVNPAPIAAPPTGATTTTGAALGVKHYICPDNCEGSGGDVAGNCPVCGKEYLHNQEFHNQSPINTGQPAAVPGVPGSPTAAPPIAGGVVPAGVKHYICPDNCEGSGGDVAGSCPVCGKEYLHNQEFHNQLPAGAPTTPASGFPSALPPSSPAAPAAAQNAAGVYHYTCPSGHAGGSGSAGSCAECGAALVHNQAYHN
jgi:hypothetical protein